MTRPENPIHGLRGQLPPSTGENMRKDLERMAKERLFTGTGRPIPPKSPRKK